MTAGGGGGGGKKTRVGYVDGRTRKEGKVKTEEKEERESGKKVTTGLFTSRRRKGAERRAQRRETRPRSEAVVVMKRRERVGGTEILIPRKRHADGAVGTGPAASWRGAGQSAKGQTFECHFHLMLGGRVVNTLGRAGGRVYDGESVPLILLASG